MTDTRTEIKAINEELEVINQFLEHWAGLPNTAPGDRSTPVSLPSQAHNLPAPPQEDAPEQPLAKSIELPLATPPVRTPLAKEILAELARSQPSAQPAEAPPIPLSRPTVAPEKFPRSSALPPPPQAENPVTAAIATSSLSPRTAPPSSQADLLTPPPASPHIPAFSPLDDAPPDQNLGSVFDEKLRDLDAQAEYVNHLAEQQVTALLKLKAIAESAEFEALRAGIIDEHSGSGERGWLRDHQLAMVPFVELDAQGCWTISSQPVDWFQAERDAVAAAEQLRRLHRGRSPIAQVQGGRSPKQTYRKAPMRSRTAGEPTLQATLQYWLTQVLSKIQAQKTRLEGRSRLASARLGRLSPLNRQTDFAPPASSQSEPSLPAGIQFPAFILWIAGAAAVRISLNILAAVAPNLVPVAILGLLGLGGWIVYRMLSAQAQ